MTEIATGFPAARYVRAGGFLTRYFDAGNRDADVVLLLHDGAWGGASDISWSRCIPGLARKYRVIAPDFLGFGGTDKATFFDRSPHDFRIQHVVALLDVLCITSPMHVVGTSFGGSVALKLLASRLRELRSVTSIGGPGPLWRTDTMRQELGKWDGTRDDLARVLRLLMDEDEAFEDQLTARVAVASSPGHYRAVASAAMSIPDVLRHTGNDGWPEVLRGTDVPTMLVAGTQDELFEAHWPESLAESIPHASIRRIDARHSPNLDRPNELVGILLEHLNAADAP